MAVVLTAEVGTAGTARTRMSGPAAVVGYFLVAETQMKRTPNKYETEETECKWW